MLRSRVSSVLHPKTNISNRNNKNKTKVKEVSIHKKNKLNKALIGAAAAAAVASLAVAGIVYLKKSNSSKSLDNIVTEFKKLQNDVAGKFSAASERMEEVSKETETIRDNANKIKARINSVFDNESIDRNYDEVMNIIEEAKKTNFENIANNSNGITRSFKVNNSFGQCKVESLDEYINGVLSRRTEFSGSRTVMQTFDGDSSKIMTFYKGACTDLELLNKDNTFVFEKFERSLVDSSASYEKAIDKTKPGITKVDETYSFDQNGILKYYKKDSTNRKEFVEDKIGKLITYDDNGNFSTVVYGLNKEENMVKELFTEDSYYKNLKMPRVNSIPIFDKLEFENGLSFEEKYLFDSANGKTTKPIEYIKGYKVQGDDITIDEEYGISEINGRSFGIKNKKYKIAERDEIRKPAIIQISDIESGYAADDRHVVIQGNMFADGNKGTYLFEKDGKYSLKKITDKPVRPYDSKDKILLANKMLQSSEDKI